MTTANILTVLPDLTFEERIGRCSFKRSRLDRDFSKERFPIPSWTVGEWEWKLFNFPDEKLSTRNVIRRISSDKFGVADIHHLLAFGEVYPEETVTGSVIALCSVILSNARYQVPGLRPSIHADSHMYPYDIPPRFGFFWSGTIWNKNYQFLGVRRR